ncbi:hypothetical protein KCP69_10775 [Salmonella enterica subsp. enterica]|nr:hypothetical protein KCP69_10775 [Salmonella enterica subsp. enterica]
MGPAFIAAVVISTPRLRDQYSGRRQLLATSYSGWWSQTPDGDADSNPLGKTRNRHGQNTAGKFATITSRPVVWFYWVRAEMS